MLCCLGFQLTHPSLLHTCIWLIRVCCSYSRNIKDSHLDIFKSKWWIKTANLWRFRRFFGFSEYCWCKIDPLLFRILLLSWINLDCRLYNLQSTAFYDVYLGPNIHRTGHYSIRILLIKNKHIVFAETSWILHVG